MTRTRVEALDEHLYVIDAWMEETPNRLACYLFDTPERVLVEVGPSATLRHLLAALDEIGVDDVATLLVTHIHIDHAGGAGQLAARFPGAKVGVHVSGARHLAAPERLWNSAVRIYGEPRLREMWGPLQPVPEAQLMVLNDGDRVSLGGGRYLEVLHTPGHAKHHVVYADSVSGGMFVGDQVGVCYPHGHFVHPVTPPPEFDPETLTEQLRRLAAREPSFLGLAHFGPAGDPAAVLAEGEQRIWDWVRLLEGIGHLDDVDAAARLREWTLARYREEGHRPEDIAAYDAATFWPMMVTGIRRWLAGRVS